MGHVILASVAITDITAFVFLAAVSQSASIAILLLIYIGIFLGAYVLVDYFLNRRTRSIQVMLNKISKYLKSEDISYAILNAIGLLLSFIFQAIGISYILGAFFAGLILHEELIGNSHLSVIPSVEGGI
ncbi:MAG: cation:proton antiporter [Nitrososphaerota archaeon]|nr:cation:proton antiporter [Nitrososphaerota archaeon]